MYKILKIRSLKFRFIEVKQTINDVNKLTIESYMTSELRYFVCFKNFCIVERVKECLSTVLSILSYQIMFTLKSN